MNECIICSGSESSNGYVEDPFINSFENSLARARERQKFKDTRVPDLKNNNWRLMKI